MLGSGSEQSLRCLHTHRSVNASHPQSIAALAPRIVVYPRRVTIRSVARTFQLSGFPSPYLVACLGKARSPVIDVIHTSNAFSPRAPWPAGSVSGPPDG